MVQRYDTQGFIDCVESKTGRYVKYDDYAVLKEKFMDYMVVKEKQIANLKALLEVADDNR